MLISVGSGGNEISCGDMVNIFQASVHCSKILVKEEVFRPQFVPKEVLHRKAVIQRIAGAIRPLAEGRTPENLFIYGDSGSGKTAAVRYVIGQLNEHTSRAKTIFVNCWKCHTRMAIYSQIANAIGEMLPRRGLATDEMFDRILEVMQKESLRCVIVLDDMDSLFYHGEQDILYDITRAGDGKPIFGLICITSKPDILKGMDSRIESAVAFNSLGIENYTQAQIADILAERAKIGLTPASWDMDIIDACASKSAQKRGNVHYGLELLLKAAKEAEGANRHRIELEDVERLWADGTDGGAASPAGSKALPSGLVDGEQLILDILKKGETDTVSLYGAFNGKMQRSGRQIRNYLKSLENKELIMMRAMEGVGTVGNKRFVRLGCGND